MSPSGTRWAERFCPRHSHVPGQPPLPVNHSSMCPQSCWFFMAPAHTCRHTQAWIHIHTVSKRGYGQQAWVHTCGHVNTCTRVGTHVCGHIHSWIHMCVYIHMCIYVDIHTCVDACRCKLNTHMCGHTQTHTHTVSYRSRAGQHPREFVKWGEDPCSLRGSDWPQLPELPGGPPVMFWSHPVLQRPSPWGPYLAQQPHA